MFAATCWLQHALPNTVFPNCTSSPSLASLPHVNGHIPATHCTSTLCSSLPTSNLSGDVVPLAKGLAWELVGVSEPPIGAPNVSHRATDSGAAVCTRHELEQDV